MKQAPQENPEQEPGNVQDGVLPEEPNQKESSGSETERRRGLPKEKGRMQDELGEEGTGPGHEAGNANVSPEAQSGEVNEEYNTCPEHSHQYTQDIGLATHQVVDEGTKEGEESITRSEISGP